MNVDVKILSKALAHRMENILPAIISTEQTGFIKGRQLFYSIQILLSIFYSKVNTAFPEVVISVGAKKAFSRVEWGYLLAVLNKFGLGEGFIS